MRRNWSVGNYRLQALFITWIFVLCSIDVGASLKAGVMATVDNRAFPADPETGNPGGPLGWSRVHYYITSNAIAGTTAYLMLASANAYLVRYYFRLGKGKNSLKPMSNSYSGSTLFMDQISFMCSFPSPYTSPLLRSLSF
jgi:hypothetical protein